MFHHVSRVSMKFSALNRRLAIRLVKFHLVVVHSLSNRFRSEIFIETKQNFIRSFSTYISMKFADALSSILRITRIETIN